MSDGRVKRPALDRTRPIRSWSHALGSAATDGLPEEPGSSGSDRPADDPVSHAVDLGYRVIDQYMQQGQRAAERMRRGTYGVDALGEDMQDLAGRLVRYVSDFGSTWLEVLDRTGVSRDRPRPETDTTNGGPHDAPPVVARPLPLRVKVRTRRSVEVTLDATTVDCGQRLVIHALRPGHGSGPRLDDVTFGVVAPGYGEICLRVPDSAPPGSYSGRVIDADTNRPVGTLIVELLDS